jgi:hypothetical protein
MDFKKLFNAETLVGRRNVAAATLGSIAAIVLYKKLTPSSKVAKSPTPVVTTNHNAS